MRGFLARTRIRTRGERIATNILLVRRQSRRRAYTIRRSMRDAARFLYRHSGVAVGEHGLAADHALAERDQRRVRWRQVDIDPRAKADEADLLAGGNLLALVERADDAPRDKPGDQHKRDVRRCRRRDAQRQTLVVKARLVEAG